MHWAFLFLTLAPKSTFGKEKSMLSLKQLTDVCLCYEGTSERCRYLEQDDDDWSTFFCVKLIPKKRDDIDEQIDEFLEKCKKSGKDPEKENIPLGDNCKGYLKLRHAQQGYDKE